MVLVSVIIPTYKRSDMLCCAIDSVLNQTYKNVEVVVVDDNNPDTEWRANTAKSMEAYSGDSRVLYVRHDKNRNGSVARNNGIKAAHGEIITYLDDDDIYTLDKIEKQVAFLLTNPKYRAVYCGWRRENVNIIPKDEGDLSYGILSGTIIIITNAIMMWRKDALECGGWDENLIRHQEAAYLLNFFRYGGQIGHLEDVLVEFDTTDRTNVSNPLLTKEQLIYLLNRNKDLIQKCEDKSKGAANMIYTSRYLGIVLPYAKNGQYIKAISVFVITIFKYPRAMISTSLKYLEYRFSSTYKKQSR